MSDENFTFYCKDCDEVKCVPFGEFWCKRHAKTVTPHSSCYIKTIEIVKLKRECVINMSDWARRQLYVKRKKEKDSIDPKTGKEEWENEFDDEEIYNNNGEE